MNPLVNPAHIAAANPQAGAQSQAARKANAAAYAAAMREAGAPAVQPRTAEPPQAGTAFAREAPFGAERPRYQRPGALVDLRV